MVAYLRVLSILHISICMPLWWLAGNCDLSQVLDIMDNAFIEVIQDNDKSLDDEFTMNSVEPIA
ncbi:hypothetical protein ACHAWF_003701 [Thalassiosira exigua]